MLLLGPASTDWRSAWGQWYEVTECMTATWDWSTRPGALRHCVTGPRQPGPALLHQFREACPCCRRRAKIDCTVIRFTDVAYFEPVTTLLHCPGLIPFKSQHVRRGSLLREREQTNKNSKLNPVKCAVRPKICVNGAGQTWMMTPPRLCWSFCFVSNNRFYLKHTVNTEERSTEDELIVAHEHTMIMGVLTAVTFWPAAPLWPAGASAR